MIDGGNIAAIGDVLVGLTDGIVCGEDGVGGNIVAINLCR